MFTTMSINDILVKVLVHSGASDNFLGTHFAMTNCVLIKRSKAPITIQQAICGSKPKSNATLVVNVKMGDWMLKLKSYMAGLVGYDSIIGVPVLEADGAFIDFKNRKVHFQEWDVAFDCMIPSEPLKRPNFRKRNLKQRPGKNGSVGKKDRDLNQEVPELVTIEATAMATVAPAPVTVATIEAISLQQVPQVLMKVHTNSDEEYYMSLLLEEFDNVLVDNLLNELPPLCEINHHIPYKPIKP